MLLSAREKRSLFNGLLILAWATAATARAEAMHRAPSVGADPYTLSHAQPDVARVTHLDLNLTVRFDSKVVEGSASLTIQAAEGAKVVVLDSDGLAISRVTDERGRPLRWRQARMSDGLGAPLIVELNGSRHIDIVYRSRPDARALQWLPPQLTAGKRSPYLFSQGQPNFNRSWIPTQDSPGVRQTWSARVVIPAGLSAVMSGTRLTPAGEPAPGGGRAYRFRMDKPVPAYLIALAVGDIAFRALGPRTGVYTEPALIGEAARELMDAETMLAAAEALYGPYRWGRFDVLVLPPSFPYGGMENPTLTFATPTFITGDRANINMIVHELAHSWSGNLVTNANWADAWLNEGFTTYIENRLMERLYGSGRARIEADLEWGRLQSEIRRLGGSASDATRLHGGSAESRGEFEYLKGAIFLRTIEAAVGRGRWDAYLRSYFDRFAFKSQTTEALLADLRRHLVDGDAALEQRLQLNEWVYGTGLPGNAVRVHSAALVLVDEQRQRFERGATAAALRNQGWSTPEWLRFLDGLPRKLDSSRLRDLDRTFGLSSTSNAYVRSAWLAVAIPNRYPPALASAKAFAVAQGRLLFLRSMFQALMGAGEWGQVAARSIYAAARPTYHPITVAALDRLLARPVSRDQ